MPDLSTSDRSVPSRAAKFVSTIFASVLAGANFVAVSDHSAHAATADDCVASPKGAAPAGGHWYYRIDRATKRHCWYVGDPKQKAARAIPQDTTPPAEPEAVAPPQDAGVRNAHAELPSSPTQDVTSTVRQRPLNSAPAGFDTPSRAAAPDGNVRSSVISSRWPESSGVSSTGNPKLAAAQSADSTATDSNASSQTATAPPAAVAPVALAAADSSSGRSSGSTQMLLMVMTGALVLAGLTTALIYRFSRARMAQPDLASRGRAIWDSPDAERAPSILPNQPIPMWRDEASRDPRAPDDPDRRIAQMLSRLARSAQS